MRSQKTMVKNSEKTLDYKKIEYFLTFRIATYVQMNYAVS